MSAVTAGSPHNCIASGRSSICHDRAKRRPVLNFSISTLTAAEDRQKSRDPRYSIIKASMRATEALVGSSSRDGQPRYVKIVLLLVSPDFLASDFCYGIEMTRALEAMITERGRLKP
jgi:hypothetical protein